VKIHGWTDNRTDSPVEYEIEDLAAEYLASGWDEAREGWPIERKLYGWLAMKTHTDGAGTPAEATYAGKSLAWDPDDPESRKAIDALVDRVLELRR
jgi:hypothetical protein